MNASESTLTQFRVRILAELGRWADPVDWVVEIDWPAHAPYSQDTPDSLVEETAHAWMESHGVVGELHTRCGGRRRDGTPVITVGIRGPRPKLSRGRRMYSPAHAPCARN